MRLRSSTSSAFNRGAIIPFEPAGRNRDDRIGAILIRDGALTPEDVDRVLARQAADGLLFGEAVVALNLASQEVVDFALARQGGSQLLKPGDNRVDPLLVAAFNLNDPYVVNIRAIRSRILGGEPNDELGVRTCALIGFDCPEELAVLAANLAVVMVRMHMPTLLIEGSGSHSRMQELFRLRPGGGTAGAPQSTAIPDLWVTTSSAAGAEAAPYERRPILDHARGSGVPGAQLIATLGIDHENNVTTVAAAARGVDTVILVARRNISLVSDVRAAIDSLDLSQVPVAGVVLV